MRRVRIRRSAGRRSALLGPGILFVLVTCLLPGSGEFPPDIPGFDGTRAFRHLVAQCDFGPRVPGSPGHGKCRDYLAAELGKYADEVRLQEFGASFGGRRKPVPAFNIIARFRPEKRPRRLLCAHWDTRPWADKDPDPEIRNKPIAGANDGASGVAVLLEIARILSEHEPPVGVDIVLFDAEDLGKSGSEEGWIQGSKHFVGNLAPADRPEYGILLDMIGDRDLAIYQEAYSKDYAGGVVEKIWGEAARLGLSAFRPSVKYAVLDDHLPFLEAGIPCVDLIDFDYPFWHTIADTPDKCSAESLEQVGRLLVALIYAGR